MKLVNKIKTMWKEHKEYKALKKRLKSQTLEYYIQNPESYINRPQEEKGHALKIVLTLFGAALTSVGAVLITAATLTKCLKYVWLSGAFSVIGAIITTGSMLCH